MNDEYDEFDLGALSKPPEPDFDEQQSSVQGPFDSNNNGAVGSEKNNEETTAEEIITETDETAEPWTEEDGIAEDEEQYGNYSFHPETNTSSETVTI